MQCFLASLVKEPGFRPLGPTSKNNLPSTLTYRVRSKTTGPLNSPKPRAGFSSQQSGREGATKICYLRACRWGRRPTWMAGRLGTSAPARFPRARDGKEDAARSVGLRPQPGAGLGRSPLQLRPHPSPSRPQCCG